MSTWTDSLASAYLAGEPPPAVNIKLCRRLSSLRLYSVCHHMTVRRTRLSSVNLLWGISVRIQQVDDRPFTSVISQRVPAVCSAHTDNLRRQEFCCQWTSRVEQLTCGTAFK